MGSESDSIRRLKIPVSGFVLGTANDGEEIADAKARLVLSAEHKGNDGPARLHLDMVHQLAPGERHPLSAEIAVTVQDVLPESMRALVHDHLGEIADAINRTLHNSQFGPPIHTEQVPMSAVPEEDRIVLSMDKLSASEIIDALEFRSNDYYSGDQAGRIHKARLGFIADVLKEASK